MQTSTPGVKEKVGSILNLTISSLNFDYKMQKEDNITVCVEGRRDELQLESYKVESGFGMESRPKTS